ncbi:MAG: S-layer homology domain-containing protein [Clostridia bacterium]|nr:S-layer homology domain-containing protein [Clostridia bacterium]
MKKIISLLLILCSLCTIVSAEYKSEADALNRLGLFKGTENGYELERLFTRAEGATMLVRLMGMEEEALSKSYSNVFDDMENHWAQSYVMYCYENNITKGTGDAAFSPENEMTAAEYLTLVLRALGYENAEPENAHHAAAALLLASSGELRDIMQIGFTRDKMVHVSYRALKVKNTDDIMLIETLADSGAVDEDVAMELGLFEEKELVIEFD